MMAWKYAITAFLIPFTFTILPAGRALLLHFEGIGMTEGIWTVVMAFLGIGFLASGCSGWLLTRSTMLERTISVIGALSFIYPSRYGDLVGFACLVLVLVMQKMRKRGESGQDSRKGA
jgi:TRAP-type uncharacterized transport system fused permease subunit